MDCKCGATLPIEAKFCSECGTRVATSEAKGLKFGTVEVLSADKAEQAKRVGRVAAGAVASGLKTDMGKSMAAGAALGAVIALPIPFVGPAFGAAV